MIEVKGLTKRYSAHTAVDNLSFTVEDGRIYGLLGPNGAGKTTTMNMITGYIAPSEGTVVIDGFDIFEESEEAKKRVGYLPEQPPVYMNMTVNEYLKFVCELKEVKKEEIAAQIESAVNKTGLSEVDGRLIKNLSKGFRQRVGVAQALLGNPKIIILDEPTVGLDPKQIIEMRELITSLKEEHTVILSSHILQEVAAVCDHIIIISHGRLVAEDTPENLSKRMKGGENVKITAKGLGRLEDALKDFGKLTPLDAEEEGCETVLLHTDGKTDTRESVSKALYESGIYPVAFVPETASLEDIFLELTEDGKEAENK